MADPVLSTEQAYRAMCLYLEAYYDRDPNSLLALVHSDLSQSTSTDGRSADPAAWSDWMEAVTRVVASDMDEKPARPDGG